MTRSLAGLLLALTFGATACTSHAVKPAASKPEKPIAARAEWVAFQGIRYALPAGWTTAKPFCSLPNHTVTSGVRMGSCPTAFDRPVTTAVWLTAVYGPQFALSWPGSRMTWHGQPAWLWEETARGVASVRLTLPLLNASVYAQSDRLSVARALLDNVTMPRRIGFDVPGGARDVFVQSLAGHDGDGQRRSATVIKPTDVRRLLADLRGGSVGLQSCSGSWWPRTALLTFRGTFGERTFAARFDDCGRVFSGGGASAPSSRGLLADIRTAVPNSGL